MKAATFTDHRRRIGRTVSHVDFHLDDEIDVRKLADIACFSPYHFLRVFRDFTEETPASMVRRLRLERARQRLAAGLSVARAAEEARFESSQAFSRAFRSVHGLSPGSVGGEEIRIKAHDAPPDIVALKPCRAITLGFSGTLLDLKEGFGHLLGLARPLTRRFPSTVASLSGDDPFPDLDQAYCCKMLITIAEEGLREARLPLSTVDGGLHAVWPRQGALLDSRADYLKLVGETLPALGYRPSGAPIRRLFHNDPALVPRARQRWTLLVPLTADT